MQNLTLFTTLKHHEERIAALERQLKDGSEKLEFVVDTLIVLLLQFAEDFNVTSPELESRIEKIRQMKKPPQAERPQINRNTDSVSLKWR